MRERHRVDDDGADAGLQHRNVAADALDHVQVVGDAFDVERTQLHEDERRSGADDDEKYQGGPLQES